MNRILHWLIGLRFVPLGRWVLILLVVTIGVSAALKSNAEHVRAALLSLRENSPREPAQAGRGGAAEVLWTGRLAPPAQAVLSRGEPAPQAFTRAENITEAKALSDEIWRTGKFVFNKAHTFHRIDLGFMVAYGTLLVVAAFWANKRARILRVASAGSVAGKIIARLYPVAILAALIGVAGDGVEYHACREMLGSFDKAVVIEQGTLDRARLAWWVKWCGVITSTVIGLGGGVWASLLVPAVRQELHTIWDLSMCAHRFAMRARFSILAAALFTILLLTGPGEDIIRTVATGAFVAEDAARGGRPDFAHLGWFAVALLVLASTCWGWARLVLGVRFGDKDGCGDNPANQAVEDRLRRDLPIYYGAMPFVAAACAFALAPLQEAGAREFPIAQFLAASLAPLLLFFILPLVLVVFRPDGERTDFGPLCWTLTIYTFFAALHAWVGWKHLGVLGIIPIILLLVALTVFGLGRPSGIFILPVALLVSAFVAARHFGDWNGFGAVVFPSVVLCAIGGLGFWARRGVGEADALHLPVNVGVKQLLAMIFSAATRVQILASMRRKVQNGAPPGVKLTPAQKRCAPMVRNLRGLLQLCGVLLLIQIGVFVLVLWAPSFARQFGSAAVLALGFGGWATAGSALIFLTQASRFPILGAALVVALLCSAVMDNHAMRLSETETGLKSRPRIAEAYGKWEELITADAKPPLSASQGAPPAPAAGVAKSPPCIIIAAEGGGIRAAMWPAIVLGTLQDRSVARRGTRPDFASHVFAISGVSGGSIGAAVFAALCADHRESQNMRRYGAWLCGQDHLAPTLGGLLYPDTLQRFLPVSIFEDRAYYFENSWENAWALQPDRPGHLPRNRLAESFMQLWSDPGAPWRPALFLNTTMVESGQRAIVSNLAVRTAGGGEFIDAHDLHGHLRQHGVGAGPWQDVPLSAAAHASARFPLVSPPGRLPSGARVVDGGYFENSAAATGLDVLNAVTEGGKARKVIFIFLRYASSAGLSDLERGASSGGAAGPLLPHEKPTLYPPKNVLNESAGIFGALLATREARGSYAQEAIFNRYLVSQGITVISFTFSGDQIPLSWSLSQRSCNDMLNQMPAQPLPKDKRDAVDEADSPLDKLIKSNDRAAEALLDALYKPAPSNPQ